MGSLRNWTATAVGLRAWSVLNPLAATVTLLTPVVTIAAIIFTDETSLPATILSIFVCFLVIVLFALLVRQERIYRREAQYAPALIPARSAFISLADASWTMVEGDSSEESFLMHLRRSLRSLAEAFSLATGASCRVSVKATATGPMNGQSLSDVEVITLCRSTDEEEPTRVEPDRIGANTDFRKIFAENHGYFFSNDLPAELSQGYQNSHWSDQTIRERRFDYCATIVWPIGRTRAVDGGNARKEVIGFLCVDTLRTGAFNVTYDEPLGSAFAQALYLALKRFRNSKKGTAPEVEIPGPSVSDEGIRDREHRS
jgi:hypothetical protein